MLAAPALHARATTNGIVLGYRCTNSGMTLACGTHHIDRDGRTTSTRATQVEDDLAKTGLQCRAPQPGGRPDHQARRLPLVDAVCRRGARRPLPPHAGPGRRRRARRSSSPSSAQWFDALLGRRPTSRSRDDPAAAGDSLEPLPARAGHRPGRASRASPPRASRARGYERPLLLGHRGLRRAVPRLHRPQAARKRSASARRCSAPPAARAPSCQPGRRALPLADDQRRGGLGLLRRRHRAVPHQRRHRLRPAQVRERHRRRRVPRPRGRRHPRRDGPAVGRPRASGSSTATSRSTSTASPDPTSTRPSSTTTSSRTSWPGFNLR